MKVLVLSQRQFDNLMVDNSVNDKNVEEKTKIALISITDTSGFDKHYFKTNHKNVLNLKFDDIEEDIGKYKTISIKQGRQIISFLEGINKDVVVYLLVHCAAGISRSGAVGTFANDYFKLDRDVFKLDNPYIHPNGNVMRVLNNIMSGRQ